MYKPTALSLSLVLVSGLSWAQSTDGIRTFLPKRGDSCLFEYQFGPKKVVVNEKLVDVTDNAMIFEGREDGGNYKYQMKMTPDGMHVLEGISLADGQPIQFSSPSKWIDLPLVPGKTWESDSNIKSSAFELNNSSNFKVGSFETVVIKERRHKGTRYKEAQYNALKVVVNESFSGRTAQGQAFQGTGTSTYWIAPDVRCVIKQEYQNQFGSKGRRELLLPTMVD